MGDHCCRTCCYSTPAGSLCSLSVVGVGVVGFLASTVYAVVAMSQAQSLQQHVVVFAPILGGILLVSVVPLLLATIMGYCVTGYIRDELYSNTVKRCIGPMCSFFVMICNFLYFLFWLLVAVGLGALLTIYVQLTLSCQHIMTVVPNFAANNNTCIPGQDYGIIQRVCGPALSELCGLGGNVGIAFTASLGFSVLVIIGMVMMLMVMSANLIEVRENMNYRNARKRRGAEGVDGEEEDDDSDYAMKNIR